MGKLLTRAIEYEQEIRASVGSGDDIEAQEKLRGLEYIYGRAGRSKNKKDVSDRPYIHGIVKSMQQLVDGMKKKKN